MCIIACSVRIYPVPAHHLLTTTVKHRFLPVPSFSKCFTLTLFPPYFTPLKVLLHVCFVARPCLHPGRGGRPPLLRPYSFTQGVPPTTSNASLSERHFKSSSTGQMGGFGLHASPLFLSLLSPPLLLLHIFLTRCRSWTRFNAATKRKPGDEQAVASDENSGGDRGHGGQQQQHDAEKLDGVPASSPTAPPLQRRGRRGGEDDRGRLGQEVELTAGSRSKSRKSSKGAEP